MLSSEGSLSDLPEKYILDFQLLLMMKFLWQSSLDQTNPHATNNYTLQIKYKIEAISWHLKVIKIRQNRREFNS